MEERSNSHKKIYTTSLIWNGRCHADKLQLFFLFSTFF